MQYRELIYEIYEEVCGSRLTTNIGRIGGFERNFTDTAFEKLEKFLKEYPEVLKEFENLLRATGFLWNVPSVRAQSVPNVH